jgi:hypothetical protein
MRKWVWVAAAAAVVCAVPAVAGAQELEVARARQGYYVAFGAGPEVEAADDKGKSMTLVGGGGALRLGQMLTPRFGLGIRIDSGSASDDRYAGGAGGLSVEGQMNVWRELAVHAGIGLGFASLTDNQDPKETLDGGYGALLSAALSYDFFFTCRTTGGWSVAPTLTVRGLPGGDIDALWVGLGVQLTWWSGRPKNELQLDEADAYGR